MVQARTSPRLDKWLLGGLLTAGLTALYALPAVAEENPYTVPDDTWIRLSGKVESVNRDRFMLDYGKGVVSVEMDDGDRDADAYKLVSGDQVTVSGRIDDDFFESTTIEASSVHVKNFNTTFYASSLDEEDATYVALYSTPLADYHYNLVGNVTEVKADEFVLDTGDRRVEVEVDGLAYNPLDDEGYQRIEVGDRVSVAGDVAYEFFDGRVVEADSVVELSYSTS